MLTCELAAVYPDATSTVNLIVQMIILLLFSAIVCRVTRIYLHLLYYYKYTQGSKVFPQNGRRYALYVAMHILCPISF